MNPNSTFENSFLGSKWFNPEYLFNQGLVLFHNIFDYLAGISDQISSVYHLIIFALSLFFIAIICYASVRLFEIRRKEKKHLEHEIAEYAHHQAEKAKKLQETEAVSKNPQWIKTLNYLFSQHQGDWKLAIIEADTMLEVLLTQIGFQGATLGDKLKSATQENFKNLSHAWEAHAVRNKIAHEGAVFQLSQHEAKRIIALYEDVFRGYGHI